MTNIILIGAGEHGSELYSYINDLSKINPDLKLTGVIDENKPKGNIWETQIIGNFQDLKTFLSQNKNDIFHYITATGDNHLRARFVSSIENLGMSNIKPWTLIHEKSVVGHHNDIGEGTCLAPNTIITTNAKIGKHCILNVKVSVSHNSVIGDFVNLNPNVTICGNVKIGNGCYIGAGATVIDKIKIGDWVVIGAGAVVTRDIESNVTAVGIPAKIIKERV